MIEMGDDTSSIPVWVREHQPAETSGTSTNEHERLVIGWELLKMIDEGLLEWGVCRETGEAIFWPTPKGVQVLGMLPH